MTGHSRGARCPQPCGDLAHPLDFKAFDVSELIIVTLPRYMLDEFLAVTFYSCVVSLAAGQVRYLPKHPGDIAGEGGAALGRCIRHLFAVAFMPELQRLAGNPQKDSESVQQRVHRASDTPLRADL